MNVARAAQSRNIEKQEELRCKTGVHSRREQGGGRKEERGGRREEGGGRRAHLAAAAAPGSGVARAAAWRSAGAAIHAGGGKSGGRAAALPGRGPLPAMLLQRQQPSRSAVTQACMLAKKRNAEEE